MEITEKKLKQIIEQQSEEYQRHNAVLYKKFRGDARILSEGWSYTNEKVDKISVQLDATMEMVGEMKEDVEVIKMDVSIIKNDLKQKVDKDDFETLEKRVMFLENKFKKV